MRPAAALPAMYLPKANTEQGWTASCRMCRQDGEGRRQDAAAGAGGAGRAGGRARPNAPEAGAGTPHSAREAVCLYSGLGCKCRGPLTFVSSQSMWNIPPPSHGRGLHRDPNACWMALHRYKMRVGRSVLECTSARSSLACSKAKQSGYAWVHVETLSAARRRPCPRLGAGCSPLIAGYVAGRSPAFIPQPT